MNRKVSIIIPNYNHEKYLKQRLSSVFNQTYLNFEVILLDDCSTDNSQAILLEYANNPNVTHCIFNKTNSGNTFLQWKKGIEMTQGDIIWIAESDDFCDEDFLKEVSKPLMENNAVMLSYCQSYRVNENNEVTGSWKTYSDDLDRLQFENDFVMDGNLFIKNFLIYKNVIPNASAVLMRKNALLSCLNLEILSNYKYCGDWILYFQLLLNNKIAFTSNSLNNFRFHENSVIANAISSNEKLTLVNSDIKMRATMLDILKNSKPENYSDILKNNKKALNELKYEKGKILFKNKQKLKGLFVISGIVWYFIKKSLNRISGY
ncbi:MAG: glycosyltransferase [Flaviramulus sp.]|nr:glycosyltransferase [Flaviramulus sp.]